MARKTRSTTPDKASKPPAKSRGNGKKKIKESVKVEVSPQPEDAEGAAKCKIDWSDENINFILLNAIHADDDIKQGLYPAPGGTMTSLKQGGKKKTVWQWKLAVEVFQDHATYGAAFLETLNCPDPKVSSKLQAIWVSKIKNRLKRMSDITREHMQTLGQTGEGIERAEDIDMSLNNKFTNKWAEILADCPWFFDMRSLIAQRPNLVPTGIGNSSTDIDFTAADDESSEEETSPDAVPSEGLDATSTDGFEFDQDFPTSDSYHGLLDDDVANELQVSEDDDEVVSAAKKASSKSKKRKHPVSDTEDVKPALDDIKPDIKPTIKKGPRPGSSKPAAPLASTKKKSRFEEFSTAAQAEELTRQKELELNKAKVDAQARIKSEHNQTQRELIQAKLEKENAKLQAKKDLMLEKMRLKHERKLARMRLSAEQKTTSSTTFSHPGSSMETPHNFRFLQENPFAEDGFATVENTFLPN